MGVSLRGNDGSHHLDVQGLHALDISALDVRCISRGSPSRLLADIPTRRGLSQMYLINGVLVYVAVGFVAAQIALFTDCRPFSDYWSVPANSGKNRSTLRRQAAS